MSWCADIEFWGITQMEVRDTGTIKNLGAFATREIRTEEFIAECVHGRPSPWERT